MQKLSGIKCESVGDKVIVRGNLFQYRRLGDIVTLDLNESLTLDEIYYIKEVIELYEDLIELN